MRSFRRGLSLDPPSLPELTGSWGVSVDTEAGLEREAELELCARSIRGDASGGWVAARGGEGGALAGAGVCE